MNPISLSLAVAVLTASASFAAVPEDETLLLQQPTLSEEHVVFTYAGDLWVVDRSGGEARRLTSSPGVETAPELSPNGRWVAFTGQYEGNADVYVIPVEGGIPRRLTYHPGGDEVVDWHPGGKHVLFRTRRDVGQRLSRLYLASIDGGTPEPIELPKAYHAAFDGDASRIAYTPIRDAFNGWKRHRGGTVSRIWIFDRDSHDVEVVPRVNASDSFPRWLDGKVYFGSDRDGTMNLYRFTPGDEDVEKLTRFTEFDISHVDAGAGGVIFAQGGALHIYDPERNDTRRLQIQVHSDGLAAVPRWQEVKGHVRSASIAPNGKRAVFEARGEIITMPREHGGARNLTQSPGVHERSPAWSNDGTHIAYFSDRSGEYQLIVQDRQGKDEGEAYDLGDGRFYSRPEWSPDDEHILFVDKRNRIGFLTLDTKKVTVVATIQGSLGEVRPDATWSPDSRWIAYEDRNPRTLYDTIALYEVATGKSTTLTDGFAAAGTPAFSEDGGHLFFSASTDLGPNLFGLDMSTSASRDYDANLYVAVLKADAENPLAPRSDEGHDEEEAKDDEDSDASKDEGSGEAEPQEAGAKVAGKDDEPAEEPDEEDDEPSIDLEGLDQRILALPLPSGKYLDLACAGEKLYFIEATPAGSHLKSFDFESREAKTLKDKVAGFTLSADGEWMLYAGSGAFHISKADGGDPKPIAIASVKVRVEPTLEWPQMLREVWRIQRDYFYDENMHGVDWPAMWDRWDDFLPHVRHRNELTFLIRELIGELSCGHQYTWGGETPEGPEGVSVGLLGADFEVKNDRYRIQRIYHGQNWNAELRAPLTVPGVDAAEGDYLISVNGRPLAAGDNLYAAFENLAEVPVELELSDNPRGEESRTMVVEPLRSEYQLRHLAWVEDNRRRVEELSGGRLAYIYMSNTTDAGRTSFDRDFFSQLDKSGVVLDERYNGGGQAANYIIDVLNRRVMSYWMNREKWLSSSPFGVIEGPKVMIINESSGSGGDWMPWIFQNTETGPLVGTRTWGGLVGISGYPPLMDGGQVTAASFGVMDLDGRWAVENVGVSPDHEVVEWPKLILAGRDPQLEKAVEVALQSLDGGRAQPRPASFDSPSAR